jgi:hypothetical protein
MMNFLFTEKEQQMKVLQQKNRRRFDLPPEAEKHLVWYGFLKRLPTTIFWLSLGYIAGFALLMLGMMISDADPAGVWLGLFYLGKKIFIISIFLFFAGWISRTMT